MKQNCVKYGGEHGEDVEYLPAGRLLLSRVHRVQHDGPDSGPSLQLSRERHGGRGENSLQSQRPSNVSSQMYTREINK